MLSSENLFRIETNSIGYAAYLRINGVKMAGIINVNQHNMTGTFCFVGDKQVLEDLEFAWPDSESYRHDNMVVTLKNSVKQRSR